MITTMPNDSDSAFISLQFLFIRLGCGRAEFFPITMCPVSVVRLGVSNAESIADSSQRRFRVYHLVSRVCYLLDSALAEPSLSRLLCVRCRLGIYLFICVFSKLFLKILSQPTIFDRFFSYCTCIIPRKFCIWLVVGMAIWRFLAFWR